MNTNEFLESAIRENKLPDVMSALAVGADPNAKASDGYCMAMLAINNPPILRTLLAAGAKPNTFAFDDPLLCAARGNNHEAAAALIKAGGITEWIEEEGETALHVAASRDNTRLLTLTLQAGGAQFVNKPDEIGRTPLALAVESRSLASIQELVQFGVSPNHIPTGGESPLAMAIRMGFPAGARKLLELGADPLAKDEWGRTMLELAAEHKGYVAHELRRILEEARASSLR